VSQRGLQDAIEQPARLAGLDVSAVTTAMLNDAKNEPGALPLVENALRVLWEQRQGNRLSGELYIAKGGIAGLLEEQADALLARLDKDLPKGRADALELLLALTRINDEGRHTRRRLPLGEARLAAGGKQADPKRGQQVIDYLTGRSTPDGGNRKANGRLHLLVTVGDNEHDQSIDLIHETLIRSKGKDETTGKQVGYWKTLYDYIDKNRERGFYRDQLARQANEWQGKKGLGRWFNLAGWGELRAYRKLRPERGSVDELFLRRSRRVGWGQGIMLLLLAVFIGQSYLWTLDNSLPPSYMLTLQKFRLMNWGWLDEPLPEMVEKEIQPPVGEFRVGEYDKDFGEVWTTGLKKEGYYAQQNFGYPATNATISQPFFIGKYEVTYEQYDYYVWQQQGTQKDLKYPNGEPSQNKRGQRAVTYVSWIDANAYLQWLGTKMEGKYQYRLPTEAEWEYVARAGTDTPYWWGDRDAAKGKANCDGCDEQWGGKYVAPIGSFAPNAFGLYDTAGNVWEWTCSEWKADFDGSEGRCVEPKNESGVRVLRGGSWNGKPGWLRSSARYGSYTVNRINDVGFRVLRSARTN
jgi:formylglycine-generating enzyme required for sulfatase activity